MQIDKAEFSDLDSIHQLLAEQFKEHQIEVSHEMLRGAIQGILEDDHKGVLLVAREERVILGVAVLSFAWTLEHGGKSVWLDELYVRPERRGRGLGRALLKGAISLARETGCLAIDLEVDEGHHRVERLYRREGFEPLPRSRWVRRIPDAR